MIAPKKNLFALIILAFGSLLPQLAQAAPFCVQTRGVSPQCIYYDAIECRRRAGELSSVCIPNDSELALAPGIGRYCLIDSNRAVMCIYSDMDSCNRSAPKNGLCFDGSPFAVKQDPYFYDPNRKY